jgi:hypothetical protein
MEEVRLESAIDFAIINGISGGTGSADLPTSYT